MIYIFDIQPGSNRSSIDDFYFEIRLCWGLARAAPHSAVAGRGHWNGIVASVNLSGKRNKQYAGLDPGCVMTIISYENSPVFGLD